MTAAGRLESWKAIARYLGRSVRTARRWERDEGLPVHRHLHRTLASVSALPAEIDAWRQAHAKPPQAPDRRAPAAAATTPIAVLPFENLSSDQQDAYFATGLTEEITTTLSKVQSLRVTSRASAMSLLGSTQTAPAIAKLLKVRYLLQGSVRRSGSRLRIAAQLIDGVRDAHLWADTFEGVMDDVFAIQERLARLIVEALKLHLTSRDRQRLAEVPIGNVAAYECYLRARQAGWGWRRDSIDHAVQLLGEALRIVGDNARLYSALGVAHLQYREAGVDLGSRPLQQAERCALKVMALEPDACAALQLRGWINYARGQIQAAVHDLKRALVLEPYSADTLLLLCNCYLVSGRVAAARPLLRRLAQVDPLTPLSVCMPAFADVMEGRFARAVKPYRQMFEMDPLNPLARLFYAWVLLLNDRSKHATAIMQACPPQLQGTPAAQLMRVLAAAAGGSPDGIQARVSPQLEAFAAAAADMYPRFLAQACALAGRRTAALRWLRAAIERGFINYPFLARHDPFFKPWRKDPGFRRLLELARQRWQSFEE